MAEKTYLDKEGLAEVLRKINEKYAPIAALIFKGTVADIAHLPALADQKAGWMYNVTTGGETTADFVEGAGHVLRDGNNVVAVNVGTEADPVFKWDIIPGVFKIEDRLQFGKEMPASPEDEQTFLYLGDTTYKYNNVTATLTPDSDPATLGLFEQDELLIKYNETGDTIAEAGKTYYITTSDQPVSDPKSEGFFEWDGDGAFYPSNDNSIDGSKTYAKLTELNVSPGDTLPNSAFVAITSNRYTETADDHVVAGKTYVAVSADSSVPPTSNPAAEDYFELDSTGGVDVYTESADTTVDGSKTYYKLTISAASVTRGDDPAALGLYNSDGADPATYTLTSDTYVKSGVAYFEKEEGFVKGVIYVYDEATTTWEPQTAGDTFTRITETEIDNMFDAL